MLSSAATALVATVVLVATTTTGVDSQRIRWSILARRETYSFLLLSISPPLLLSHSRIYTTHTHTYTHTLLHTACARQQKKTHTHNFRWMTNSKNWNHVHTHTFTCFRLLVVFSLFLFRTLGRRKQGREHKNTNTEYAGQLCYNLHLQQSLTFWLEKEFLDHYVAAGRRTKRWWLRPF